jgi:hypothetical protein
MPTKAEYNIRSFETQTMDEIAFNLVNHFNFQSVTIETQNVKSGLWIKIGMIYTHNNKKQYHYIAEQQTDIVKWKLIDWLNELLPWP